MFRQIIIYLTALQAHHVIATGEENKATMSECEQAYSQLENLCYNFTGLAGDYFSVQDIHKRDGFFAVREAAIYVAYNACDEISTALCTYRSVVDLEKDKVGAPGATPSGTNPPTTSGSSPTPPGSTPPTPPGSTPPTPPGSTPPTPPGSTPPTPPDSTPPTPPGSTPPTPPGSTSPP